MIAKEGRKRKVVIKDAKVTDAGNFKCVSNADETACELIVKCKSFSLLHLYKMLNNLEKFPADSIF